MRDRAEFGEILNMDRRDVDMIHAVFEKAAQNENAQVAMRWSAGSFQAQLEVVVSNREIKLAKITDGIGAQQLYDAQQETLQQIDCEKRRGCPKWISITTMSMIFVTWGVILSIILKYATS